MDTQLHYYLAFSHFLGIGPMTFKALLEHFGTPERAYEASKEELSAVMKSKMLEGFLLFRNKFDPEKKLAEIQKKNIIVLTREYECFPPQFRQISDTPIFF